MKNLNLLLLTVLLICSTYTVGFGLVGPFTASAFTCLHLGAPIDDPNTWTVIRGYQNSKSPPGIDQNAIQTFTNAFVGGYTAAFYMQICRGINATSQITLVQTDLIAILQNLPSNALIPLFVMKIEPSSNPDCTWEGYLPSDNCNFLKEAVGAIHNIGQLPVVFSTARIWQKLFGSSCDTFASDTSTYLVYANYESNGHVNSTQTFDDFVSFGGWSIDSGFVVAKQVFGNTTVPLLCGSIAWHAYVDQFWSPFL